MKYHRLELSENHLYFRESLMLLTRMRLGTNIIRNPYPYLFQSVQYCHLDTWDYLDSFCLLYQNPSSARTASHHNSGPCGVKRDFCFISIQFHNLQFFFKSRTETTGHESNFVCLIDGLSKIHILHRSKACRYVGLNGVLAS